MFIACAGVGTLGFAIYIYMNASLKNRILVGSLIAILPFPARPNLHRALILILLQQRCPVGSLCFADTNSVRITSIGLQPS